MAGATELTHASRPAWPFTYSTLDSSTSTTVVPRRGSSGVDVQSDVRMCVTCGGCIWRSRKGLRPIGTADHRHHARHGLLVGGYLSRAHHMNGIESCSWGCAWWASWRCSGCGCVPGSDGTIGFCQGFGPQLKNWGRFMSRARSACGGTEVNPHRPAAHCAVAARNQGHAYRG